MKHSSTSPTLPTLVHGPTRRRIGGRLLAGLALIAVIWALGSLPPSVRSLATAVEEEPAEPLPTPPADTPDEFIRDGKLDLEAVVQYFEDIYRSKSSRARAELKIVRPRRERTMKMRIWTKGEEKALIVIEAPAREKGTATLKVEDNLWNYLPRIRRTIRIPPSMMLSPWMGSDFTNDDLVRETSYSEDYTYRLVGPSEEPPGWRIRFEAKPGIVGLWSRFELIVSRDGRIPVEAEYFDRRGRLARTIRWDRVKTFDGRRIPSRINLEPKDQEGNRTVLTYQELEFDLEVPDSTFSLSRLEQKR